MRIQLVEGIAMAVEHGPAGVSFCVDERPLFVPARREVGALETGQYVHVLVASGSDAQPDDVLVMRWGAGEPIYFGPQLSWLYFLLGVALSLAALEAGRLGFLSVPILLGLIHSHFLTQRCRMLARFGKEVSTRLALLSLARESPPAPHHTEPRVARETPVATGI